MKSCRRAAAILHDRRKELAVEAAREGGKPLVDSLVEADRAVDSIRLCADHLCAQAGGEIPMDRNAASAGRLAFTHHEPVGVVVAFSAFNHPLNLIGTRSGRPSRPAARRSSNRPRRRPCRASGWSASCAKRACPTGGASPW